MNKNYWLLGLYSDGAAEECFIIGLEARTEKDAIRAYNWQLQGQGVATDYDIAKRTGVYTFKSTKSDREYEAEKGAYTAIAWQKFSDSYK